MALHLLGCVHHTCNDYPFYCCNYDKMQDINNIDHVCKLITNEEKFECYNKLLACYNNKTTREEVDRPKAVRKWAGKKTLELFILVYTICYYN